MRRDAGRWLLETHPAKPVKRLSGFRVHIRSPTVTACGRLAPTSVRRASEPGPLPAGAGRNAWGRRLLSMAAGKLDWRTARPQEYHRLQVAALRHKYLRATD